MAILLVVQFFKLFWNLVVSSLGEFRRKSYLMSKFGNLLSKVRFFKIQFFISQKRGSSELCQDQKSIQNYWFMGGCFSAKFRGICRGTRYRYFIVVPTAVCHILRDNFIDLSLLTKNRFKANLLHNPKGVKIRGAIT